MAEEINDELIKKMFFTNNEKRKNLMICKKSLKNISKDIQTYLDNRYKDSNSTIETIKRIYYGIEEKPCCPVCGTKLKFVGMPSCMFPTTCSRKCNQNYKETRNKIKQTCIERYGVENGGGSKQALEKIKQTCIDRYNVEYAWQSDISKQHCQETMLKNYGVIIPYKNEQIKEKGKQKCLDLYGVENGGGSKQALEKIKQTCEERYGVNSIFQVEKVKQKIKLTNLNRYGTEVASKSNIVKQTLSKIISSSAVQQKIYSTKKKNNSFHISKQEIQIYESLKTIYPSVIHNYRSDLYPFNCDFYIPDLDMYIEYQGTWTHGDHPYNPNSTDDIAKVELWKNKNTKYYDNAINNWTIRDVKKRNIAKKNNLNYIELWNIKEANEFIEKIKRINK